MSSLERRDQLRAFLVEKRARRDPKLAGLPVAARRRVPGLRREEVAELAGISVTWYALFERGDPRVTVSLRVVNRIAEALQLDVREREQLASLALPRLDLTARAIRESATLDTLQPVVQLIRASKGASINELVDAVIAYINTVVDLPLGNVVIQSLGDGRVEIAHGTRRYAQAAATRLADARMLSLRDIAFDGSIDVIEDVDALPAVYQRLIEPFAVAAYCAVPIDVGRDYPIFVTAAAAVPMRISAAQRAALRLAGDFAGAMITRSRSDDPPLLEPW